MKSMLSLGLGFLVVGCSGETDCEDYANSADPECKVEDTASDTGTAEDTADTASEEESGFTGTISVNVVFTEMNNLEDGCTGVISMTYDADAPARQIGGSFNCSWVSELGQQFEQLAGDGMLEGDLIEGVASGTAWYGPIEGNWEGAVDEAGLLTGSWSDHQEAMTELGLPAMDHSGTFSVQIW